MNEIEKTLLWNALVNGVVPDKITTSWIVGREQELEILRTSLEMMTKSNVSQFKLIEGDYGFGKTLLMKTFEAEAIQQGYVVARFALGTHNNFSKPEIVYKDIMSNIRTKQSETSTDFEMIFESWLKDLKLQRGTSSASKHIFSVIEELSKYNATFSSVLLCYIRAIINNDLEIAHLALAWINGDYNISVEQKKRIGVRGSIDRNNAFDILQGFSKLVELLGYKGLVIFVDELEYIMRERQDIRDRSYTTLRHLIDEIGLNRWNKTFFLGAYTPDMINDKHKGFSSYEALYQRIQSGFDDQKRIPNNGNLTIIRLSGLSREGLLQLARQLISLSDINMDATLLGQLALVEYAKREMSFQKETSIRGFIKVVIHVIQLAKTHPEMPIFKVTISKKTE
jgi:hypothetical protein